ncbi:hypothetical protein M9H77_23031 [Catharanthus roseus]|uniref:Uncharacterized protein n=1 Tax=Catharanthus roseus TaxID=4058 RepID=A0ACC0AUV5_CATRO|nr:hypothetical protein M9H77_23031 [Catharanthus roseus]
MGFAAVVEAATQTEMADQMVIQRKVATGPVAPPYKHYATDVENQDTLGNSALRCNEHLRRCLKSWPTPAMRGAAEERNNKPQVKEKVYTYDGLPVDAEAEVVEVSTPMGVSKVIKDTSVRVHVLGMRQFCL